jgi:hypothetical protein
VSASIGETKTLLHGVAGPSVKRAQQVLERGRLLTLDERLLRRGPLGRQRVGELAADVVADRSVELRRLVRR